MPPPEAFIDRPPGEDRKWGHFKTLPCRLSVEVPIPGVTVEKLLDLAPGLILGSSGKPTGMEFLSSKTRPCLKHFTVQSRLAKLSLPSSTQP
jgi:hypothetical protein